MRARQYRAIIRPAHGHSHWICILNRNDRRPGDKFLEAIRRAIFLWIIGIQLFDINVLIIKV